MLDKRLFGRHPNTTHLLHNRSYYDVETLLRNRLQTAPALMDRLALSAELNGHTGCVNGLDWSANGRLIASVSDDRCLRVWDAFRARCLVDLTTVHQGNVFAVKFLPQTDDRRVVTGAADSKVCVYDVERGGGDGPLMQCTCHTSRVKSVAVLPDSPDMLWTSGEDGVVCQFDLRVPHTCQSSQNPVLLINLVDQVDQIEIKSIAINARRPEMLAVGASDPFARVYDRRQIAVRTMNHRPQPAPPVFLHHLRSGYYPGVRWDGPVTVGSNTTTAVGDAPESCVQYFCPGHIMKALTNFKHMPLMLEKTVTYVAFSPAGDELLVNMGADHVYLFDVNGRGRPQHVKLPKGAETGAAAAARQPALSAAAEAHKTRGNALLRAGLWMQAIDAYGAGIRLAPNSAVLYQNRAAAYMKRAWYGDVYAALRDCQRALSLDPGYVKAHFRWTKALLKLDRPGEAAECMDELLRRFPAMLQHNEVLAIRKDIQAAVRAQRAKPEMFLCETEERSRRRAFDYEERFVGHCNRTTDIKQANFFGADGRYIVAGSDEGNFFIWDRTENRISRMLRGDQNIVNCVLPHPFACLLATSGLDDAVRLWSPHDANEPGSAHAPKQVEAYDNGTTCDVYQAAYNNEQTMRTNQAMVPNLAFI